eukprot:m.123607 g.123607  ORF g.123607 m.123607 type:complete len:87 (-) comp13754_c0_seq20:2514-2774(-)
MHSIQITRFAITVQLARCPNDKNQTPLELAVRADAFGVCLELFKYLRLPEDTRALCKAFVEACKYSFTAIQLVSWSPHVNKLTCCS